MAKITTGKKAAKEMRGMEIAEAAPYRPTAAEKKERQRWQAEDAIRTLTRAEEIKKDAALMKAVKSHAAEQVKTMQKVCKS